MLLCRVQKQHVGVKVLNLLNDIPNCDKTVRDVDPDKSRRWVMLDGWH